MEAHTAQACGVWCGAVACGAAKRARLLHLTAWPFPVAERKYFSCPCGDCSFLALKGGEGEVQFNDELVRRDRLRTWDADKWEVQEEEAAVLNQ